MRSFTLNKDEQHILDANTSSFQDSVKEMSDSFKQMSASLSAMVKESISDSRMSQLYEITRKLVTTIAESYHFDMTPLADAARKMLQSISEYIKDIDFPAISEERKQQLLLSYRRWGEYGWTLIPVPEQEMPFDTLPESKKEADKIMKHACSKDVLNQLFQKTFEMKNCKRSHFEEAKDNFNNKQFLSCALVLFSLIDARLIYFQRKAETIGKQRAVGLGAVKNVKKKAEETVENHMLFTMLYQVNVFACLEKVFDYGKDFKQQPDVINRNFLMHGMLTRKVTKRDCIQLFLLYYNILDLLHSLTIRGEKNIG